MRKMPSMIDSNPVWIQTPHLDEKPCFRFSWISISGKMADESSLAALHSQGINTCVTAPAGCIALALVFLRARDGSWEFPAGTMHFMMWIKGYWWEIDVVKWHNDIQWYTMIYSVLCRSDLGVFEISSRKFSLTSNGKSSKFSSTRYQLRSCGIAGSHPTEFAGGATVNLWGTDFFCQFLKENLCIWIRISRYTENLGSQIIWPRKRLKRLKMGLRKRQGGNPWIHKLFWSPTSKVPPGATAWGASMFTRDWFMLMFFLGLKMWVFWSRFHWKQMALISAILPMLSPGPDFALLRIVAKSLILPLGLPRFLDS